MLWTRYRKTRDTFERNQLVCKYSSLVQTHAGKIIKQLAFHVSYDEIESAAYFGLIKAIERFDPARETKFETFSSPRIRGAVMDWLRLCDLQTRGVRSFERAKENAIQLLNMDGPVSESDIARHLKMSDKCYCRWNSILHRGREVCLSFLENSDSNMEQSYQIVDANVKNPSATIATEMFIDFILVGLSKSERIVILHYYFGGLTLQQTGEKLGISESRVSQIKVEAQNRIRARLQNTDLSLSSLI